MICQEVRVRAPEREEEPAEAEAEAQAEAEWEAPDAADREVIVSAPGVERKLSISRGYPAIPSSARNAVL
jgi:uncharacterized protein YbjT (DUF2867 family)